MPRPPFDSDKQSRLLAQIEAGRPTRAACAAVGISTGTLATWVKEGRQADEGEKADFARRYDALMARPKEVGLSERDLIGILERQARRGSVSATKLLLTKPWSGRTPRCRTRHRRSRCR